MHYNASMFKFRGATLMERKTLRGKLSMVITSTAIALGTLTALPATASSLNFSGMFVFGDSNSDVNKNPVTVSPFYEPGRFSNGRVWIEYLADDLDIDNANITNFAFGGGTTGSENIAPGAPGLTQQIDSFLNSLNGQPANPDALYTLWTGANDYIGNFSRTPIRPVNNLLNAATTLADAGARNIIIPNLPDLSLTPLGRQLDPATSHSLRILTRMHNRFLSRGLRRLGRLYPEVNFISFDVARLFKNVINRPERFGLTNVTDACTNTNLYSPDSYPLNPNPTFTVCNNPEEYLFWDSVHITTNAHQVLAKSALDLLLSELEEENFATLASASISVASASSDVTVPEPASIIGLLSIAILGAISATKSSS
jgi:cholinesterase